MTKTYPILACGLLLTLIASVVARQPAAVPANPTLGCRATPAELEANKKVALEFFRTTGADRVALADPSYKQHNPAFKKRAEENKVSDYEEFSELSRGGQWRRPLVPLFRVSSSSSG